MRFSPLLSLVFLVIAAFARPGFAAPSNDHFAERPFITGFSNTVVGTTVGATAEASDPTFGTGELSGKTIWWGWNAPFSGIVSISTAGTSFRHYLAVYTGSELPALTKVTEQFSAAATAVLATFPVQAGTAYALLIDGLSGASGDVRLTLTLHPGPANDDFEKRTRVTGTNLVFVGNNQWATAQAGEPPGCENSVWWSWTAPEPGTLRVMPTAAFPGLPPSLWCFTGAELSGLGQVGAGLPLVVTVERGVDYAIRMGSDTVGYEAEFNLVFESTSVYEVPNDHFTNRIVLSGTNASFGGSVRRATSELGLFAFPGDKNSLWWSWTAPMDGGVVFTLSTPNFAPRLSVYTGNALSSLKLVTSVSCCNDATFGSFTARRGETYSIMVGSFNGVGEFTAKLNMFRAPPNDHFANREVLPEMTNRLTATGIVLATGALGSSRYASVEAGESVTQSVFTAFATVWWTWRPTLSGRATLEVRAPGSSGDRPLVGVYTGDVVSNLVPTAVSTLPPPPPGAFNSRLIGFNAAAGVSYHIQVGTDTRVPITGDISVDLTETVFPSNDAFDAAIPLVGDNPSLEGNLNLASVESGEPPHGSPAALRSVWYSWVAPGTGPVTVDVETTNTSVAMMVAAYVGNSLSNLNLVAGQTSNSKTRLSFLASSGQLYRIAVADSTFGQNWFTLKLTRNAAPEIRISDPAGGELVGTPGIPVPITAQATDPDGAIRRVEFVVAGNLVASMSAPPYRYLFTNAALQVYDVVATATDDLGLTSASDALWIKFPPTNDMFAARARLSGFPALATGTTAGATRELGEPLHAGTTGYASVWWSWTAPSNGWVVADMQPAPNSASLLGIHTGDALEQLTQVASRRDSLFRHRPVRFTASAGVTYQFALDSDSNRGGPYSLAIIPAAPNDDFSNRTRLLGTDVSVTAHNLAATKEPGEPITTGLQTNPSSVWWSFLSPTAQTFGLSLSNDFFARLDVYTGSTVSNLTGVLSANIVPSLATFQLDALAGTEYQIRVSGVFDQMGTFSMNLKAIPIPSNDNFEQRLPLVGRSASGTSVGSSAQIGEPSHGLAQASRSVWWTWTAASRGFATLTFSNSYNGAVAVYTGDALISLSPVARLTGTTGVLGFPVASGTSYQIAFAGGQGAIDFSIDPGVYRNHDNFADAWVIRGTTNGLRTSNLDATTEPGELPALGKSVWWNWTPLTTANYSIAASFATATSNHLAVYQGSSLGSLTPVAAHVVNGRSNVVTFAAASSTNYWIQVDSSPAGDIALDIFRNDPPQVTVISPAPGVFFFR